MASGNNRTPSRLWFLPLFVIALLIVSFVGLFAYRLHRYNATQSADPADDIEMPDSDQIDIDLNALSATIKISDFTALRTELLMREQDIADLTRQNTFLQATTAHKIRLGPGPDDFCLELGLTDYVSALDGYTSVMNRLFAFAKSTPELKGADLQEYIALKSEQAAALKHLKKVDAEHKTRHCKP